MSLYFYSINSIFACLFRTIKHIYSIHFTFLFHGIFPTDISDFAEDFTFSCSTAPQIFLHNILILRQKQKRRKCDLKKERKKLISWCRKYYSITKGAVKITYLLIFEVSLSQECCSKMLCCH